MSSSTRVGAAACVAVLAGIALVEGGQLPPWGALVLGSAAVLVAAHLELRRLDGLRHFVEGLVRDAEAPGGAGAAASGAGAAAADAAGRRAVRLLAQAGDAIGRLAAALDGLAGRLERRQAQLRGAYEQQGAILAAMAEGLLALDRERRVVHVNDEARRLLGIERPVPPRTLLSELTRAPAILRAVDDCFDDGERVVDEFQVAGRDPPCVLLVTASPSPLAEAGAPACVLVLQDVTELRRLEQVRRDFVAAVSHELRTPLTSILGFLESVLDDPQLDVERRQQFLGKVQRNTERILAIVSDLLDLARIEGSQTLELQPVSLGLLAAQCVDACREQASQKQIELVLERGTVNDAVEAEPPSVVMALSNLLDNALKYTPAGGHVKLALGGDSAAVYVDVIDDGPGIALHEQERIFERFYRVDKDRSRALGGTGLGLSIVRNVARRHGGQVAVHSRPGQGCRFRLSLPRHPRRPVARS